MFSYTYSTEMLQAIFIPILRIKKIKTAVLSGYK